MCFNKLKTAQSSNVFNKKVQVGQCQLADQFGLVWVSKLVSFIKLVSINKFVKVNIGLFWICKLVNRRIECSIAC